MDIEQPSSDIMNEWRDYQQLVLSELKKLNENIEKITEKVQKNHTQIEVMKVKSGFFGSISGMITFAIIYIFERIFKA